MSLITVKASKVERLPSASTSKAQAYEIANNSYARGISLTLANDIVGTGPRLQMRAVDYQHTVT